MAGLEPLNSLIGKFVSLWQAGLDASLELKTFQGEANAHIHVGLGQAPCLQKTQPHPHHYSSPSHVRRRARRAEARRLAAAEQVVQVEEAVQVDGVHTEEAANPEVGQVVVDEVTAGKAFPTLNVAGNAFGTCGAAAVEVTRKVNATVEDEVCPNDEYLSKLEDVEKMKCTIQLFPEKDYNIELFRDNVENYFSQGKEIIERVVNCKVENSGRNIRLESIVKRKLWINFFSEPQASYVDLSCVKRVIHDCRD